MQGLQQNLALNAYKPLKTNQKIMNKSADFVYKQRAFIVM